MRDGLERGEGKCGCILVSLRGGREEGRVKKKEEEEGGGGVKGWGGESEEGRWEARESVKGLGEVLICRRGTKTDSMELHRHTDPSSPNAIALRARKASLYGYGAGRYWDRVLR